jgi:molybdopterin-guanine dinucleotide biosynthesis protein A
MTAIIIAGGQSRRMKTNKAFVKIGGKRLIERVLQVVTPLFPEVLINSNQPESYAEWDFPVITDIFPGKGALGGIYTGLVHAKTEYAFCVACDMPSLNQDLIRFMQQSANGSDALIPRTPDGIHPLHAVYSKRCCQVIKRCLQEDRLRISYLLSQVRTRYLTEQHIRQFDPTFESFCNVNTLDDLRIAKKKFQENGSKP